MKERIGYIYKITNPKGAVYIGQTINLTARKYSYKTARCKLQYKIYNSIKKYGWDTHKFEIIYQTKNLSILTDQETFYIKKYNSYYQENREFGMNLTKYGNSTKGIISKKRKAVYVYNLDGSFHIKSECISYATKEFNFKTTQSLVKIIDKEFYTHKGFRFRSNYKETIEPHLPKLNFKISQWDLDNNYITTFKSVSEASRITKISRTSIGRSVKSGKKFNGYYWKLVDISSSVVNPLD